MFTGVAAPFDPVKERNQALLLGAGPRSF